MKGIIKGELGRAGKGSDCMVNQDPTAQEHAGECETRRYTRLNAANVVATSTTTLRVREDQVLSLTQENTKKGKRERDLS